MTGRRPPRRTFHRVLGAFLLVPCIVWAATGLLFHWKPGWAAAYASLSPRTYPLQTANDPGAWTETRRLRTVLGEHLLVQTPDGWQQWDEARDAPRAEPTADERRLLFDDAIQSDPERYGSIERLDAWTATTSTGVEIDLDWDTLRFNQSGKDTRRIDLLYRAHYLQWTGTKWGDRIVPLFGLAGLAALALLGLRLLFRP